VTTLSDLINLILSGGLVVDVTIFIIALVIIFIGWMSIKIESDVIDMSTFDPWYAYLAFNNSGIPADLLAASDPNSKPVIIFCFYYKYNKIRGKIINIDASKDIDYNQCEIIIIQNRRDADIEDSILRDLIERTVKKYQHQLLQQPDNLGIDLSYF